MRNWLAPLMAIAAVLPVAGIAHTQSATERRLARYAEATPVDAISRLQKQIDNGAVSLNFDARWGYLPALLTSLKIPTSSQTLVYSKTSFQIDRISPRSPRAVYFGDDVYVGWVQRGTVIEVATVDPALGAVFYTLDQKATARPVFQRQTHNCLQCHDSSLNTGGVPGFVVQSVYTDRYGYTLPAPARHNPVSSDRSPFAERFGGWYVTGTHGSQTHMGNIVAADAAHDVGDMSVYIDQLNLKATSNVSDLSSRFNSAAYLSADSDIVALSLLIHQTSLHNLMTEASLDADSARADSSAESLVRALLFAGEARLTSAVKGSPKFVADFVAAGPRDAKGRSLRDLDLTTRLLKYPLSYLIYSEGFDGLPAKTKAYVARRLADILSGQDAAPEFAALTPADRQAIVEILRDTKPGFLPTR